MADKKEKKSAAKRGRRMPEELLAKKIKLLVKENPKREGTASYKEFALYKSGMTVGALLEKGLRAAALRWDLEHKFIALA